MFRVEERYLEKWLGSKWRKPLVVRGARQVGKSTLVRQFAKKMSLVLHEVNLERYPELNSVFASKKVDVILGELEQICKKGTIDSPGSLLFLDEIQAVPEAIPCLRYFLEDIPSLPVVAAGSLLELALARQGSAMPVGRIEYLFMGPMTFEELLTALGLHFFAGRPRASCLT